MNELMELADINTRAFDSSKELDKIFAALAKAQAQMTGAKKDNVNPFFKSKYADLNSCIEALRYPLSSNGLSIIQLPNAGITTVKLTTVLAHSSGQWISSVIELKPTKTDPQGHGSALSYARRYSIMSITGLASEDDDGNAASVPPRARKSLNEIMNTNKGAK